MKQEIFEQANEEQVLSSLVEELSAKGAVEEESQNRKRAEVL